MTGRRTILPQVIDRFRAYHARPGNEVWGLLHIVLEDGNYGDDSVRWCWKEAQECGDREAEDLAMILYQLSKTQRSRLAKIA